MLKECLVVWIERNSIDCLVLCGALALAITAGCIPPRGRVQCNATTFATAHGAAELEATPLGETEYGRCPAGTKGLVYAKCGPSGAFYELYADCDPSIGESAPAMLSSPSFELGPSINEDGTIRFSWSASSRNSSVSLVVDDSGNFNPFNAIHAANYTDQTYVDVTGIPLDGSTPIYAQLSTITGPHIHTEVYAFEDGACADNPIAQISSHEDDDLVKTSEPVEFVWSDGADGATYALQLGTVPHGSDLGVVPTGEDTSVVLPEIAGGSGAPLDEITLYATLWTIYQLRRSAPIPS